MWQVRDGWASFGGESVHSILSLLFSAPVQEERRGADFYLFDLDHFVIMVRARHVGLNTYTIHQAHFPRLLVYGTPHKTPPDTPAAPSTRLPCSTPTAQSRRECGRHCLGYPLRPGRIVTTWSSMHTQLVGAGHGCSALHKFL